MQHGNERLPLAEAFTVDGQCGRRPIGIQSASWQAFTASAPA